MHKIGKNQAILHLGQGIRLLSRGEGARRMTKEEEVSLLQ